MKYPLWLFGFGGSDNANSCISFGDHQPEQEENKNRGKRLTIQFVMKSIVCLVPIDSIAPIFGAK